MTTSGTSSIPTGGIEQGYKGDEEDIQSIINEQKDELRDVLLALDFPADEIDEKLKLAQVVDKK